MVEVIVIVAGVILLGYAWKDRATGEQNIQSTRNTFTQHPTHSDFIEVVAATKEWSKLALVFGLDCAEKNEIHKLQRKQEKVLQVGKI